jgi:hydroxyethylthiazole kinase-like uncharacterized protein yjeF
MQKIFDRCDELDTRAAAQFGLTHEVLMENAAFALSHLIRSKAPRGAKVLYLCGGGNNGADGYASARMLSGYFDVAIMAVIPPKSDLCQLQAKRAKLIGVPLTDELISADVYVDCVLGSGQRGTLDGALERTLAALNARGGVKIACDMPTGLFTSTPFAADYTLTMGALKTALFEDFAKDAAGVISVADLGVDRELYEGKTDTFLLDTSDLVLPRRAHQNTNKGDFGHLVVVSGLHAGASTLSGLAALTFGAGLVSLLAPKHIDLGDNPSLMQTSSLPPKTTAVAAGMGLGEREVDFGMFERYAYLIDADLCYDERIRDIKNPRGVLTPHPKEFASLLRIFGLGEINATEVQKRRFELAREFSRHYKGVLVLKGANTIIAHQGYLYVCDLGNAALAKGGSGDVLAGLIASLLAQGSDPLDAAKNGVLAHALAARKFAANNYALTPEGLIGEIRWL